MDHGSGRVDAQRIGFGGVVVYPNAADLGFFFEDDYGVTGAPEVAGGG